MERKILFFDIDGTLFDCGNGAPHVSDILKKALKQLQDAGHMCFIASGRPFAYLNNEIQSLGFDGFILCNGALVLKDGKQLIQHYIEKNKVKDIINNVTKYGGQYTLVDTYFGYCPKEFKETYKILEMFQVPMECIKGKFDLDTINVAKIEAGCQTKEGIEYLRGLKNQGFETIEYEGAGSFEINDKGISKGKTILDVLELLNISVDNSIAFGDGDNDVEMLQVVGHGVAMGNGVESVKAVADKVTETCVNEGIVRELQRLNLVKGLI